MLVMLKLLNIKKLVSPLQHKNQRCFQQMIVLSVSFLVSEVVGGKVNLDYFLLRTICMNIIQFGVFFFF